MREEPWPGSLVGWTRWFGRPIDQKVMGSIPSQGIYLDCMFNLQSGSVQEETDWCFSLTLTFLFLSLSLPLPLSKIYKHILRWE